MSAMELDGAPHHQRSAAKERGVALSNEEKDKIVEAKAAKPSGVPPVAEARNTEKELRLIRENYLGKGPKQKKVVKPSEKFARIFQFDWDANDDTSADLNPLYARRHAVQPLLGRGYVAGLDMREQRKTQTFASVLSDKRMAEARRQEEDEGLARAERKRREDARKEERERLRRDMAAETEKVEKAALGRELLHWTDKALGDMTDRDWRIMKEDFDIRIRGGKAPLPLRFWGEADLGEPLLMAIRDAGYKEPSPIQRQAIPVGLELRDIIGIAGECKKLTAHMDMNVTTVVGGMSIEDQAFVLREGVEIIVGTPGRIQDCLDTQYLVLNQANYVVLDEADRMIDMGFEPQVHSILEEMGGLLLSEDDIEMEQQRLAVQRGEACYRITAMFSATMPSAVEKLAKKFLRHPAIVCIGDEDSGKNKRIAQHVLYIAEAAKKNAVVDILRKKKAQDKYLVFCNEKKGCDALAKVLSTAGLRSSVLHGGKTQEHRDATLAAYKAGSVTVLVATDVAGRGLDIPDVAHVVNYDMPLKIENYSHRIGRTGRAGKDGVATTLLTDSDEAMMYDLRQYLEQTDAQIPERLEKNPAAHAKPGERNDRGELLTNRLGRNKTEFLREDKFAQG
ncbi:helicase [Aureococcus anophagefferens]|nr:helicase [Aureococcus anophagefferens]